MQIPLGSANGPPRDRASYTASIIDTLPDPTLVLDGELRIKMANRAFYEYFITTPSDIEDKIVFDIPCFEWDGPNGRNLFAWLHRREYALRDLELVQDIPLFGERVMAFSAQKLPDEGADPELITCDPRRDRTEDEHANFCSQGAASSSERQKNCADPMKTCSASLRLLLTT